MITTISRHLLRLTNANIASFAIIPQFFSDTTPQNLLSESRKPRKRTKTVCTIGPKTQTPQASGLLLDQGLSVARLNFSHGDHEEHRIQMVAVQQALKTRPHNHASILLDTKGPQIRTGQTADGKPIVVTKGQKLQITTDYQFPGTAKRIACSYKDLHTSTQVGKKILIADGGISTKVINVEKDLVTVEVLNDGKIGSRKNMCLPGCSVNLPTITKKDEIDIIDFGLKHKVNYIAVSFARYKKDLDDLRKLIIEKDPIHGPYVQLISKIQNHQAIHNLDEIIEGSDGIMVARGDLGMQVPIEKVIILQKYIKQKTINAGKTVITATQMLQSMETKPRPTRAEVSDISNSIFDMTDANMTSGQTTNGQFPTECARILRKIAQEIQHVCDYKKIFQVRKHIVKDPQAVGAVSLSFQLGCDFLFIKTDDIRLVTRISSLRPQAYIIVFTDKPQVKGALSVNFGVYCYKTGNDEDPTVFIQNHGQYYGIHAQTKARILTIETKNSKIYSSRIHQIN